MSFRNISAWAIRNPVVPIVLFIGLTLAGFVSFMRMQVNDNPDIDFPAVVVQIVQPGAAPTEIETQVTQRIEAAVRTVEGVDEISSTASEGSSQTIVQFRIGFDTNEAVNEVKNAIDQIRGELPDGILEPQVSKVTAGGSGPIGFFAVRADDMTIEQLSWFIDDTVTRRLLNIEGMSTVERQGGVDREIRIVLDPVRMQSLGVTAAQINSAVRALNTDGGGGKSKIAGVRQSVRVLGNARSAFALGETRINIGGGRSVRLSDVADVRDSYSELTSYAIINGTKVVTFSVQRSKGASDVTVYNETMRALKELERDNSGIHFTQLFTTVEQTKVNYHSSMESMVEGAVLAIVVVFFFLRDWRATVISALAIPLSAIPTFWFMDLLGFTLNTLSLLALSLVAGVLVDDAIVEIENIVRHMRMGKSAYQASIDAADEIGLAVVATTMSIVAVFLPVGLMPGISGQFFKNFGLTVVAAVLMSLAVARTITPMVAAYFLKSHGEASHGEGRLMDLYMKILPFMLDTRRARELRNAAQPAPLRPLYFAFATAAAILAAIAFHHHALQVAAKTGDDLSGGHVIAVIGIAILAFAGGCLLTFLAGLLWGWATGFDRNGWTRRARYIGQRLRARAVDHRIWAFGMGLGALGLTVVLLTSLPQEFQPVSDSDTVRVNIEMVPGTTLDQTAVVADQVAAILAKQPEVDLSLARVREATGNLYVRLRKDRKITSQAFSARLTPVFQHIPDARVTFASQSGGGTSGRDITVMLTGSDPDLLQQTAQTLVEQMQTVPGLVAPRIAADLKRPELIIAPRPDLAAQLGVTTSALSEAIRIATLGEIDQNAAKFSLTDRQIPIRVVIPPSSRENIATIQNLPVPTANGDSVPLSRVAEIRFGAGPTQIQRFNQSRRIVVGADLGPGVVKGPVMDRIYRLPIMKNLPTGVSNKTTGDDKWQAELIQNFIIAVISGVLMVFAVLVLLYKRFVSPLVNMTSLLLAPLGGLLALMILGQPISIAVYIGLLMLLGIVAKNSILLIDFAIEEMHSGVPKYDAIIDAGHKRAQPILMTTVAMVAGMVPTALSLSGDGAWRAPMGTTVIGGLLLSTLLTLVIVPAGFSLADGLEKRLGPALRARFLTYRPGDHKQGTEPAE